MAGSISGQTVTVTSRINPYHNPLTGVIIKGLFQAFQLGLTMISKELARFNITKAYLEHLVANRLFWDTTQCIESEREYYTTNEHYETMRRAYIECDMLTYSEMQDLTTGKYTLSKIEPSETE